MVTLASRSAEVEIKMDHCTTWLTNGKLITPKGIISGVVGIEDGRIAAIRHTAPTGERRTSIRGAYVAPGFIDLHIWGDPKRVAQEEVKTGTTSFLTSIGPESPEHLIGRLVQLDFSPDGRSARCLGAHLEGPFLNPLRAGALASRWLRPPTSRELRQLVRHADGLLKLVTIAPEMPKGIEAVRWCARHGIVVSVGHSNATAAVAQRAIAAGAVAVTHIFNGMPSLHHRDPGLLGEALTDTRLTAMVILDGVHVKPVAFQLLVRCKGPDGVVLVTDSIRHQAHRHAATGGAFYTSGGLLAGSRLTMIQAVRNAVAYGRLPLPDAVRMATRNPARLLGLDDDLGALEVGQRADLVAFDRNFRVTMTLVDGQIAYQRRN
ncbi:MAG: N-acetylglucosamine-6-phosphate deacetylase [Candidatus Omnitrophica bacterium]|nr:N-acetylglucosamine-6-phosphate deacetylase [Candidatus Omnitrophota bacterium]